MRSKKGMPPFAEKLREINIPNRQLARVFVRESGALIARRVSL
jgi:hypothetical protein